MKNKNIVPEAVNLVKFKINRLHKNKNKVRACFVKTNHPLTTGFVIQDVKKDSKHNAIFYSLLSFDFYFYSNENKEIYSYLENGGVEKHMNSFFDENVIDNIEKYLITL